MQFDKNKKQPKPTPVWLKRTLTIVFGTLGVLFVAGYVSGFIKEKLQADKIETANRKAAELLHANKEKALIQSYTCVEKKLKSPGSAQFAYVDVDGIEQRNDSTFVILSYVDSQNDFGALKRTYFKAWVVVTATGARCEELKLEEQN